MSPNDLAIRTGPSVHAKRIMASGLTGPGISKELANVERWLVRAQRGNLTNTTKLCVDEEIGCFHGHCQKQKDRSQGGQ